MSTGPIASGCAVAFLTLTIAGVCQAGAIDAKQRAELALHWAPIHHQDVHTLGRHALGGAADYITSFDFDADGDSRNNWENCGRAGIALTAHAYYAVVETKSHWFVSYLFFHPRDWSSTFLETEHENDAEGVLMAVTRDGTRFGALRAAITVVHSDFYSFVPESSNWSAGAEDVDGVLRLLPFAGSLHPVTAQQAETHALKAWPYYAIAQQGVVYYPSLELAEVPSGPNDRHVSYQLHDVLEPNGMWQRRHDRALFASDGAFAGNVAGGCGQGVLWCRRDAAHAPWAWDDHDDDVPAGAMVQAPALLVRSYFATHERVEQAYEFNPFR